MMMRLAEQTVAELPGRDLVEQFLYHEALILDEKRWEDWMALFTDDGTYWIPTADDQTDPDTRASIMYDDRTMMQMRVRRLRHPEVHAQTPASRTTHLVTNIIVAPSPDGDGDIDVSACFTMLEYRIEEQTIYGGRYRYRLAVDGDDLAIRNKTVHLVNCDAAHQLMAIYL
ncbi:MAG: aromatic-ring-hydroxylating dioxygenase subunit beta [Minwuia sp.]|nr:aromatic-ring-hydroxylating dioxygenase subunit beta [Minwuia sp.]